MGRTSESIATMASPVSDQKGPEAAVALDVASDKDDAPLKPSAPQAPEIDIGK